MPPRDEAVTGEVATWNSPRHQGIAVPKLGKFPLYMGMEMDGAKCKFCGRGVEKPVKVTPEGGEPILVCESCAGEIMGRLIMRPREKAVYFHYPTG